MKREVETPEEYLAALPAAQRPLVDAIRDSIRRVVPEVEETIRYGMLDYPGLANLGAQKQYVALYVAPSVLAKHKAGFPGVNAGKSCLRFKKLDQVDAGALAKLLEDVRQYRDNASEED